MTETLKILMLEDNNDDAEIVQCLLIKEKLDFEFKLANNKVSFLQALDEFNPGIILADNSLPQFTAREALEIVRRRSLHIPFIMVTGTVSEEFAADIIKLGADDYILKDRMNRLPAAIAGAIKQQKAKKENQDAIEETRRSIERFQTLSKATKDAVWDWNVITGEVWWNKNFFNLLGFKPGTEVPKLNEWTSRVHPIDKAKVISRLIKIKQNKIHTPDEDEVRFILPNGAYITVRDRTYVLKDDSGKPVRAIGVLVDITEQKRILEEMEVLSKKARDAGQRMMEERIANKIERQKEVTRIILQTKEMERNILGRELHDNINQILASVSLRLGYYIDEPDDNMDTIENCRDQLEKAIREARKLSHQMVMPSFSQSTLKEELELLIENYSYKKVVKLQLTNINEKEIPSTIKETLFRIAQEQLSNIAKHAQAGKIGMRLSYNPSLVTMVINDNGIGFDMQQKRKGIGITNIYNRVEPYNGTADIFSRPGEGCTLSVTIPLSV